MTAEPSSPSFSWAAQPSCQCETVPFPITKFTNLDNVDIYDQCYTTDHGKQPLSMVGRK